MSTRNIPSATDARAATSRRHHRSQKRAKPRSRTCPRAAEAREAPYLKRHVGAHVARARRAQTRPVVPIEERHTSSLASRLAKLGLASHEMRGDGNCQFRGLAFNLFGSQDHHAIVTESLLAIISRAHADFFEVFFDGDQEFERYLSNMSKDRHWGDELTLRAAVEAYACVAHISVRRRRTGTSCTRPKVAMTSEMMLPVGVKAPPKNKDVHLSYAVADPLQFGSCFY